MLQEGKTGGDTTLQQIDFDWTNFDLIYKNRDQVFAYLQLESGTQERIRQIAINTLRTEFKSVSAPNLYVRGSFARGDFPCDDIDMFHYGPTEEYRPDLWPSTGVTRPVSYDHIPQRDLEECFTTSACMSCASLDCLPITRADTDIESIISQTRRETFTTRNSYYLLFRLLEEKWNNNQEASLSQGYDVLKRYPGSKRTVQRIFWILQATIPQYQDIISPATLLLKAREDGLLSDELVLSAFTVTKCVKNPGNFDKRNFMQVAATITNWYHSFLEPQVLSTIASKLPPDYLKNIFTAINRQALPNSLSDIARKNAESIAYANWLLTWSLSGNPSCPQEDLYFLWKSLLGKVAYRCVLQNLLYNSSFPKDRVIESELEYDSQLLLFWNRSNQSK